MRGHEMVLAKYSKSSSSGQLAFLIIVVTEIILMLT